VQAIWDFAGDLAFEADRRHAAAGRQVVDRIMTEAQRAAVQSDDSSIRFDAWREILEHPAYQEHARSTPLRSPDWSVDWPAGTTVERTGPGQWHALADDVRLGKPAVTPQSPVWFVGWDLLTDSLERVAQMIGIETVRPDASDPRLRSIPPTDRLVVRNSIVTHDDARGWLRPLLDQDPTLGPRTLLVSAYDPHHFGTFFEETGVRLLGYLTR